ncbi:DUF485 domain-containing protein [Streptomyces gobiensis]|uniref:DUF485 domain-containing protein n=1 Tax=Streptomyces gobiensis TaxID=2875706 RepID=UPI001E2FB846|nr:DUF485 domain-containing protein [Streptomyces gobiensis]UGY94035.1 DUF485 domain-containing protein [Streptomyces gobiensis]
MTQHDERDDPSGIRLQDPWYDALASGWGEGDSAQQEPRSNAPAPDVPPDPAARADPAVPADPAAPGGPAAVYLAVHRSEAFQEVRRRHRRFVFPATVGFLGWYLAYIITVTAAPGVMGRPVGDGPFNVGMLAGLGQFATTALLTWAYAWNARLRRDRAALELRWETQQRSREAAR